MNRLRLYNSDCRNMAELEDESVQCVVTSPPYYQLRSYDGEQVIPEWGCAFGQETTVEEYISHNLEILTEVKRVLHSSGICFWNIADSYASGKGTCFNPGGGEDSMGHHAILKGVGGYPLDRGSITGLREQGLKPKDLCLIPERFALGAQAAGWWVRSKITWCKTSGMPESVKDRPSDATETIFMLTKSSRYYYDSAAVRENLAEASIIRLSEPNLNNQHRSERPQTKQNGPMKPMVSGWHGSKFTDTRDIEMHPNTGMTERQELPGRNLRNWWTLPTEAAYKGGHIAVFPEKIPEICIAAATREGDTVLDPFAGSGTTLYVARRMGRDAVGYELSAQYCKLIEERNAQGVL